MEAMTFIDKKELIDSSVMTLNLRAFDPHLVLNSTQELGWQRSDVTPSDTTVAREPLADDADTLVTSIEPGVLLTFLNATTYYPISEFELEFAVMHNANGHLMPDDCYHPSYEPKESSTSVPDHGQSPAHGRISAQAIPEVQGDSQHFVSCDVPIASQSSVQLEPKFSGDLEIEPQDCTLMRKCDEMQPSPV
ncbi:uncharacterized protein EI90DRAFT_3120375 [Cantharellus anzutake]|uniref:uncharacterized protein n=1 Tax=Cantharellus anzutake TaxID=1750568 RepID=UPI001903BF05|nr:uncharacterized protein EI90DRAFT_3120375 [Cantharellus anzutake]KAF8335344.1 hypothetical protein EI90DRAFT_3120375 [Cantharellus anzutake]